jgi:hypothetical protein
MFKCLLKLYAKLISISYVLSLIVLLVILEIRALPFIIFGVFYLTVGLSIFAVTLFLNLRRTVYESNVLSFLSFFLFPSIVGFVIFEEMQTSSYSDTIYAGVTISIFLGTKSYLFYKFRKDFMNDTHAKK